MARRYGLTFWVVMLAALATFASAPQESAEFSWRVFQGVGEFGAGVVSELVGPDDGEVR